ncbi:MULTISPECIES: efflux RND transporter periplasmic adaptor subunit [Salinivibrio]|uniref:Efflux transporter periplasmic adaptor subunit n=1 Tax=Salinivibrio costicola subsp. alcaliphilus TaxID=272773 RepID=A0ABX3KS99_SALCS|nr:MULTISPECIES: efflux RND transporter periplasmic adaptor subunit [Salinivibrio]OOF03005.1 efflux transporter periplasmic adaptor subunit [Salinivibrio sp. MA607]OOF34314.1 efflux transporter periplasmic adaptor subunit [Salinivibrio costicola subsp. alcaliphilus]
MKGLRWILPLVVLGLGYLGYTAIAATESETQVDNPAPPPPIVDTQFITPTQHQVVITGHGELMPLETTQISAQVSGEVMDWHPNFVAGGIVKRGDVLFSIEADNYQAAVLSAEADLASAQAALIEEQAQAAVAKRQAKSLPPTQVTDLYLRKPQLLTAKARVKSAQATLKRAQRDLDNCQVTAPYDALVVSRDIGVGQYISAGTTVGTINNVEVAEVHVPVAGFDSAFLPEQLEGIQASLTRNGTSPIHREGTVVRDLGIVEQSTRMMRVVVRLDDPYGISSPKPTLPFGSYVEVAFNGTTLDAVFKLPQALANNRQVWVVDGKGQLSSRALNIVRAEGQYLYADQGLSANDQIVTTPPEFPEAGMTVRVASQVAQENDDDE